MITAVYLENPFKPQNRVIRQISAAEAPAVIDAVALLNANLSGEMILSVNGQKVAADHALKDGDFVVIAPNVLGGGGGGGKNIAGIVAGIALMAFSGGAGAGLMGILGTTQGSLGLGLALYFGGSLLMGNQKTPKIDVPRTPSAFEGGYGWSPNQIRLQPGSPMPITFGTIRTSGQLIARRVYSGDFAGRQTQFLSLLLAAGEGPIDSITDIEINDTPIASIQGATYETRLGANDQTSIPGIISSVVEFQAFSSEIPLSTTSWITKAQTEPGEKVMLDFVFPAGLYAVDTGSGATVDCEGVIRWQYREIGAVDWLAGSTHTSKEKVRRPNYVTMTFTPPDPAKLYEFRAQNRTLKHFQDKYGGVWLDYSEMPGNYSAAVSWVGLTVTSARKQSYPGVALVYINLPATENLSGSMPRVSWKQTRSNILAWNPSTEAYEQKDATNIAWMSYDLLHYCRLLKNIQTGVDERIVFGEPKENLNYAEFSAWAAFCAETAGDVSRGRGNALIDAPEQIWPVIQKIATSGRAFIIQQAGVFKPIWDAARNMSQIFTAGNIIDGSLSGSFLPERERASALEVSFYDEDNGCERTTLFVPGDDYNPAGLENPSQIFLPCITSSKAAYMWAKHQLKKNKYLKRTATLQADIDSIVAELGDVVGIQSDITSWGVGGRIMGATTTSVVIDQAVTLAPGSTYSLLIRYPDNTLVRRVVDAVLVSTTTTTLNFTGAPWPTAPERYCVYSFGINTLETKPFQITGIRRNGDLQATLELLEYIEDVYTEATDFPVIDYTAANAGISSLTVKADSDTGKLGIAWTIPTDRDYTGSVVYVDGKPQGFFTTDVTDIDVDVPPGTHTVTVRPVDGSGNYGTETEEEVTLGSPTLSSVSAVSLTSTVRGQADGTNLVYITGTFTIPDLASSVLVEIGEGSNPTAWATVQDSRVAAVQYGPVLPGTLYTLRFTAKNRYAAADPVLELITTAGDTTAPNAPSIGVTSYLKTVKIAISLASVPSDMAGFAIYRHTSNNSAAASQIGSITSKDGRATYTDEAPAYGATYYYWVKSFDTWGNLSAFSSAGSTLITAINGTDIVDGALSRSALFQAGVVDAAAIASQAVTNAKLANDAVNTAQIAAGAITELKLANDAVTAAKLNVAAIDGVSGNIVAGAVGELQLAANAVTAAKIKAGEVGSTALAAGAVTELKIAAAAVTEAKIAAAAVNTAQLNNAALKAPLGAVLSLSAKNCTAASIAEVYGVRDVSGNMNHGQAFGGVTVVDTEVGKAFDFDGVNDHICTPVNLFSGTSSANPASLSLFIKHDSTQAVRAGDSIIFGQAYYSGFGLSVFNGRLRAFFRNSVGSWTSNNIGVQDAWQHIALVWGGQSDPKVYVYLNGILIQTLNITYANFDYSMDSYPLRIAAAYTGGGLAFTTLKGQVAHPKAFNRALTAAEVKSLYMFPEDAVFGNITADLLSTGELITKTAQIKDAIITSAKIDSLDAAKITTGTLAAARIATGSLAADKITGGALVVGGAAGDVNAGATTINGGKITASSVTASQLASNSVTTDKLAAGSVTAAKVTSGELITLTAQIKDAVVTSAKIDSLDAAKITTGTLAAARIAAGSLTADKITGGALVVGSAASDVNAGATTINGGKITASSVTASQLASNSVTSDKICALAVTTAKLAAGAVTAEKMLIGAPGAALNDDPGFMDPSAWETMDGYASSTGLTLASITDGKVGTGVMRGDGTTSAFIQKRYTPIDLSKTYRLHALARKRDASTNGTIYLSVRCYNNAKSVLSSNAGTYLILAATPDTTWTEYNATIGPKGQFQFPPGTAFVRIGGLLDYLTTAGAGYELQDFRLEECTPSTLIQDGAIITDKLAANAVTAAKVSAGAIETAALAAGCVTADKILVSGGGAALNLDPGFNDSSEWSKANGIVTISDGVVGNKALSMVPTDTFIYSVKPIPFSRSKNYLISVQARTIGASEGPAFQLGGCSCDAAGTVAQSYLLNRYPTTSWTKYEVSVAGTVWPNISYTFLRLCVMKSSLSSGSIQFQDFRIEEVLPGTLIKDGAITTDKLAANAVTAAKVSAGAIETAALAAGAVTADKVSAGAITSDKLTSSQIIGKDIRTAANVGNGTVSGCRMTSAGFEAFQGATRTVFISNTGAASFEGTVTCGSGSKIAGFTATTTDLTAGTGTNAIGISTDTSKKAFWAGHATPASAPFHVDHDGTGKWGNFTLSASGFSSTHTGTPSYTTLMKSSDSGANCGFENKRTTTTADYAKVEIRNGGIYLSALNAAGAKYISVNCSAATMMTIDCLDSSQTGIRINTGNIYIGNNCSALSFTDRTDRTEMPESMEEALEIINTMQPTKSKVDYKRLSNKAKHFTIKKHDDGTETVEEGRDLTKTVSALVMVCQKLQEENIRLSDRLAKLEAPAIDEEREYIEAVDKIISENRGNIRARMDAGK